MWNIPLYYTFFLRTTFNNSVLIVLYVACFLHCLKFVVACNSSYVSCTWSNGSDLRSLKLLINAGFPINTGSQIYAGLEATQSCQSTSHTLVTS